MARPISHLQNEKLSLSQGGSVSAQGVRKATFWAISNPYPFGTPAILSPWVLGCQPGGLWVPRLLPVHFGAFEGVSTIKSSLKACPCIPMVASKRWKSRALSTKPRELHILARVHQQHGHDQMCPQTTAGVLLFRRLPQGV